MWFSRECGVLGTNILFCFRPPVRVVCPNHKVVVFQHWTGTAPYLGSVANYTFYSTPSRTTYLNHFSGYLHLHPLYYRPQLEFVVFSPTCCTRPPPPIPVRSAIHLYASRTRHPPASAACLCKPAPHACICRRVPWMWSPPPLTPLACSQVSFRPWEVRLSQVPLRLCAPASPSLRAL